MALASTDLTPDSSAVTFRLTGAEYSQSAASGCAGAFLTEIPPEKLSGSQLEIEASWDRDQPTNDASGAEACTTTKADVVAYGRARVSDAWRVIDFRTLAGAVGAGSVCEADVVEHGPGEPELPNDGVPIWLTPRRYAGGLRVSIVAAAACHPLPIVVKVAENFD
ncbi:MAG: hypothetical protein ABI488_13055 [Polyangiaceae bacterium]